MYTLTYFYTDLSKQSTNNIAYWDIGVAYWKYAKFASPDNFYVVGKAYQINNLNGGSFGPNQGIIMTFNQSESRFLLTDTMKSNGWTATVITTTETTFTMGPGTIYK